jgi:hypothetical protein
VGKGKGGVRPGLFNCVGLASHQPTGQNDTSLVTLCKGLETKNLETFCKYLRNAHSCESFVLALQALHKYSRLQKIAYGLSLLVRLPVPVQSRAQPTTNPAAM